MKKPLCTFPWGHLDIETNGDIKYCCASLYDKNHSHLDENGNHYNVNTHTISEAWNSDRMRELRRKLHNGIKAPECKVCWEQEAKGQWSVRTAAKQAQNDCYPDIQETVDRSAQNDYIVDDDPKYYQIQTGNMCNLACKMCHSDYSTTYGDFYFELYPDDVNQTKYIDQSLTGKTTKRENNSPVKYDWPIKIGLSNLISGSKLEHITRLFLSGGEPTIIVENLKFLEYLVESGHSKHIHVIVATNTTKINPRFAKSIQYFEKVTLILSIDAVEEPIEIQRYPAKWSAVEKNISQYINIMKQNGNINIAFNVVVSLLTLPTIDRLIDYLSECNSKIIAAAEANPDANHNLIDITALFSLDYGDLNLDAVPLEVATLVCDKLKYSLEKNRKYLRDISIDHIEKFIEFLENFPYNHNNDYTQVHFALNKIQEHHPDRDIKSIFPVYFS
jgi:MoaA/NifB/PqqE/SkfB family radical SAM enzyme